MIRHAPDVVTQLVTRFSEWTTTTHTIEDRLPWINTGYFTATPYVEYVFTTSADHSFWGTLIVKAGIGHSHSPWMYPYMANSGNVLYWIREDE